MLAKVPGRHINPKQKLMNQQLALCVRLHLFYAGLARELAALRLAALPPSLVIMAVEEEVQRGCARKRALVSSNIQFLAGAETVSLDRLRAGIIPVPEYR